MTCKEVVAAYFDALKGNSSCKKMPDGRLSIVLPFLYPDHDNVEIFVKENAETVFVTDLGETLRRLDAIGIGARTNGTVAYQLERQC